MNWSAPVDLYCERLDATFWSEPVNAISNVAFLVAAALCLLAWIRNADRDAPSLAHIIVVAIVGLGSFAFHTLATRGAVLLDVIPIAVFIYGYLALALCRFLALPRGLVAVIVVVFAIAAQAVSALAPRDTLNGSVGYLPALAAMIVVASFVKAPAVRRGLWLAAAMFAISLVFRTIDRDVCPLLPLGTHWIWHILNAVVLYMLLRTAMAARSRTPPNSSS
jgi:hypothetical protein